MYAIDGMHINPYHSLNDRLIPNSSDPESKQIQVLLIEDNPSDATLLKKALTKTKTSIQVRLTHLESVTDAITYLNENETDVILLDFSLPDSIGLNTFQMLRDRYPDIPIIILTGHTADDIAIRSLKMGAQDFISKSEMDGRLLLRSLRYAVERHQLQIELQLAHKRQLLSQKLESLGLIAGGVAHDFNNLLGGISGNAELAEIKSNQSAEIKEFLKNIITACKRGGELCNQLMAYSGKGYLELTVCDLNEIIEELHPLIGVSLNKSAEVKYDLNKSILPVEVDSVQIRQIIMNLLTNASDALGDKPGIISVETGVFHLDPIFMQGNFWGADSIQEWKDYNYVKVEDNGSGMTQETISKIFDPFFTTKFSGRGLGLAAVLGIVQAHNGALKVSSHPGDGSCFWFLLPTSHKRKSKKKKSIKVSKKWKGHGTVLIADDESDLRDALNHYSKCNGFKTLLAKDGLEAIEIFKEHKDEISIVLLDMTMPRMNGKELYDEIIKLTPDMRVILMSGYTEKKIEQEMNLSKSIAFIKKPFRLVELKNVMQKLFI